MLKRVLTTVWTMGAAPYRTLHGNLGIQCSFLVKFCIKQIDEGGISTVKG